MKKRKGTLAKLVLFFEEGGEFAGDGHGGGGAGLGDGAGGDLVGGV